MTISIVLSKEELSILVRYLRTDVTAPTELQELGNRLEVLQTATESAIAVSSALLGPQDPSSSLLLSPLRLAPTPLVSSSALLHPSSPLCLSESSPLPLHAGLPLPLHPVQLSPLQEPGTSLEQLSSMTQRSPSQSFVPSSISSAPISQHTQGSIGPIRRQKKKQVKRGRSHNNRGATSRSGPSANSGLAEKQNLCSVGRGIIVTLGALAEETVSMAKGCGSQSGNFNSVEGLLSRLVVGAAEPMIIRKSSTPDSAVPWATLGMMAQVCHDAEMVNNYADLMYWVSVMQFASQVLRETTRLNKSMDYVYKEAQKYVFSKPGQPLSIWTLKRYCSDGTRGVLLAGAGSFYIIILLACAKLRPEFRKLTGDTMERIAKVLRSPPESADGRVVKSKIIPCLAYMRNVYPLRLRILFQPSFLHEHCPEVPVDEVDCTNIAFTDKLFDKFLYCAFTRSRDQDSWKPLLDPLPLARPPSRLLNPLDPFFQIQALALPLCPLSNGAYDALSPLTVVDDSDSDMAESMSAAPQSLPLPTLSSTLNHSLLIDIIETGFDPLVEQNYNPPYPKEKDFDRYPLTESERERAAKAVVATSVLDFSTKLKDQLTSGFKPYQDSYVKVDAALFDGRILRINDINHNPVTLLFSNMPSHLRSALLDPIALIYPDILRNINSEDYGNDQNFYHAIHFDWYNRYTTRGDGMDVNSDPATLVRNGKQLKNSSQNIPRASEELKTNSEQWVKLQEAFAPVFEWIRAMLKEVLPEEYGILSHFVDILPCHDISPVYPFSGFVLNVNVTTLAHRDPCDEKICLILVISDCKGGELCFVEPGLVIRLRSGDIIIFPSTELTHFNTHYSGYRVSLVLHTDKSGASWVKDFNGWNRNTNINTSCVTM